MGPVSSVEVDLVVGVAGVLADATDLRNTYTYRETGAYQAADGFGIYIDATPENVLDAITVTEYGVGADVVGGDEVVGVQFRIAAADRRAVKDAIADLRDLFHGRWGGNLGAVKLIHSVRASGTPSGADVNQRQVRMENYYLTIYRPPAA